MLKLHVPSSGRKLVPFASGKPKPLSVVIPFSCTLTGQPPRCFWPHSASTLSLFPVRLTASWLWTTPAGTRPNG